MRHRITAALAASGTFIAILAVAGPASATSTPPPPPVASSCQGVDMRIGSGSCLDQHSAKASDYSASSSIDKFSTKGKLLVSDMNEAFSKAQQKKEEKLGQCHWFMKGGADGMSSTDPNNTAKVKFPWPTKACRDSKSPSGWIKVDSHDPTGWTPDCGNWFWPKMPKGKILKPSQVQYVGKSFEHYKLHGTASAHASAHSSVVVKSWCNCTGSSAHAAAGGSSNGYSASSVSFTVRGLVKMREFAKGERVKLLSQEKLAAEADATAKASARANSHAWAKVSCTSTTPPPCQSGSSPQCPVNGSVSASAESCVDQGQANGVVNGNVVNNDSFADIVDISLSGKTTSVAVGANSSHNSFTLNGFAPGNYTGTATFENAKLSTTFTVTVQQCTPPPVNHWTQNSCTGFEEITGGGSFLVDCVVSDDNGAQISMQAHSNDGNSRVSGVNCYSNGGSQTCPSGGTFEFRVTGINDGSTVVYSSVTAIASANGITATYTSDQFPVDPSGGGF